MSCAVAIAAAYDLIVGRVVFIAMVCSLAIAACGSSASNSSSTPAFAAAQASALAFTHCMRSHAVPNFPDPSPGGGFPMIGGPDGINMNSPAFQAAQKACQKLMPGAVPGGRGHPSAELVKAMLARTKCMREHGVPDFPDPIRSPPASPGHGAVIGSQGVYFWLQLDTVNYLSPAFKQAASRCGFNLPGVG